MGRVRSKNKRPKGQYMKKFLGIIAAAALAVCLVAVAGCSKAGSGEKFVVGFDQEYPPYGFIDTKGDFGKAGDFAGFDLELAKMVADANGWEFSCVPIDWDAKDTLLESGQITCIWNGFTYEGRETGYQWSDRYMTNAQVVVTKAGSGISSPADLAGKVVMTQVESAGYDVITSEDFADVNATFAKGGVQVIDTYANAFMNLESGACDAVVCDLSIFMFQDAAKPGVFANVITLSSEHYAVGFAKDNADAPAMIAAINKAFADLDAKGEIKKLCERYANYGTDYLNWCL